MKIAIVHDDLVQWGGLERVLWALSRTFPDAPIYTIVTDTGNKIIAEKFKGKLLINSFLQKIPGWRLFYKPLFLFHPFLFEQFDLSKFDVVVSLTTRFAKSVITKPPQIHLCYCFTPPRFLWKFPADKTPVILESLFTKLRLYDQITARRVDYFYAGSINIAKRIKKIYKRESKIIPGFVDLKDYANAKPWQGDYFLVISRLNEYKRVDLVVKAFSHSHLKSYKLKIIGSGPQLGSLVEGAGDNIEFLGEVSETLRLNLLAGAKALILPGEEDFGLTPLEAQAMGKPVIAFGKGGVLETVKENMTGIFFYEQTESSLVGAVGKFLNSNILAKDCLENSEKFSLEIFQKRFSDLAKDLSK